VGRTPQRIVCLTAETAELAFALGCADRVVGVTGYAVRPPEARRKPRVSAFRTASLERIITLQPDLVLGFSDLQSDIAASLIRAGLNVLVTNQRTLEETFAAIELVGRAIGKPGDASKLAETLRDELESLRPPVDTPRPAVFFEEWDDPLISGIAWVNEIIEITGGRDIFPELSASRSASERIVAPDQVVARKPDIIIASWCGKKARLDRIASRHGWNDVPAVMNGHVYEVKAPDILQPGLSLIHGARQIAGFVRQWQLHTTRES
jgi:iron complex transport system substrate-binding protein